MRDGTTPSGLKYNVIGVTKEKRRTKKFEVNGLKLSKFNEKFKYTDPKQLNKTQRKYEENYMHKIIIKLHKSSDKQEILKAHGKWKNATCKETRIRSITFIIKKENASKKTVEHQL